MVSGGGRTQQNVSVLKTLSSCVWRRGGPALHCLGVHQKARLKKSLNFPITKVSISVEARNLENSENSKETIKVIKIHHREEKTTANVWI